MEMLLESWHNATYWWGLALLLFSVCVVMTGIINQKNNPPWDHDNSHPVLEFCLFWLMLFWISMLEGCQISVVGLQGFDSESFRETHPRAYRICKLVHSGPNVERFLVGRQFLLLFNGFLVSRIGGGSGDLDNFEMHSWTWEEELTQFFFGNGTLLMIVIVALGQLPTQLVAADKMLGFFELPLGHYYIVLLPCLFVESLGFTHSSYLLKDLLCWISGIDQSKADPEKALKKDALHYIKCIWSVFCVFFSLTFITKGLLKSQTNATEGAGWHHLPGGAAVVVSFFFIFMLASAEGIQVSVIALKTVDPETYMHQSPLAYRVAELSLRGSNMSAFLAGRQFLTAMNMVLLARVTSYAGSKGELKPGGDWGMSDFFNEYLLQWGFLGAILVVNVAQLASQVTASLFPISVINNHFMYWLLNLMLFVEFIGIVNACWPLSNLLEKIYGMEDDPVLVFKKKNPNAEPVDNSFFTDEERKQIMDSWHSATYWWGLALLGFALSVVMHGIFTEKNNPPWEHAHPLLDFVLFCVMLFWIAMLEGCQISVVGLQVYDPESFRESHPRAYKCCKLVHDGPNVERFLVGRQFLLLFNGFLVSRIGGGSGDVSNFEMHSWTWEEEFTQFFFGNGTLLMIVIVALGQLPTQLVAADKMLGFFELPLGHYYIVVLPCLFVESLGFTHSSYLLKD